MRCSYGFYESSSEKDLGFNEFFSSKGLWGLHRVFWVGESRGEGPEVY